MSKKGLKKMLIFADFHHAGLLNSLILLFEKRLGGSVYRPIGIEWASEGFWSVYPHPATQAQFLTLDQGYRPIDGTAPLNQFIKNVPNPEDGVYYCQDIDSGEYNKAITLKKFLELPIDIVIASIPQHIEPFKRLCKLHPNNPKLIFQIGNAWTIEAGNVKNIMASAIINDVPESINFISYHQEFDLDIFHLADLNFMPPPNIYSFVNCFDSAAHFTSDWELFTQMEKRMPDYDFKSFGGQCRDGAMNGSLQVAEAMRGSRFIWQTKAGGDGYGHVIHNAPAVGRPLIVKREYYQGKMAESLLIDGKTCITIDNLSTGEIETKIRFYSEQEKYLTLCKNAFSNFKQVVDFDKEESKIREFLTKLQ